MPLIMESEKRLEKFKAQLEAMFEKQVAAYLNSLLKKKGFMAAKYLNGILNETRTKEILALFEKSHQAKSNACLTPEALGKDVVTMEGG